MQGLEAQLLEYVERLADAPADDAIWRVFGDWLQQQGDHAAALRGRCIALELAADDARARGDVQAARELEARLAALAQDEREALLGAALVALERSKPHAHQEHFVTSRLRRGFIDHAHVTLVISSLVSGDTEEAVTAPLTALLEADAARLLRSLEVRLYDDRFAEDAADMVVDRVAAERRAALRTVDLLLTDYLPTERGSNAEHAFELSEAQVGELYAAAPRLKRLDCSWYDGRALFVPPSLEPRFV